MNGIGNKIKSAEILYFITSFIFFYIQLNIILGYCVLHKYEIYTAATALVLFKFGEVMHEIIRIRFHPLFVLLTVISVVVILLFPSIVISYGIFSFSIMKIRRGRFLICSCGVYVG